MDRLFARFATGFAHYAGQPFVFVTAAALVLIWAVLGPVFGFSETWQLVINTGTTIVTFLMVFIIQNTQNRDSEAMHTKMDELIRSSEAENRFVGIEKLSEHELDALRKEVERVSEERGAR